MTQKIILLCGKKQSGKTSASNFLHGYFMLQGGSLKRYEVDEHGNLLINTEITNVDGDKEEGTGILDFSQPRILMGDRHYIVYAQERIWNNIRRYSLADPLKEIAIRIFGLTLEQCYGTNEQKNSPTKIKWNHFGHLLGMKRIGKLKKEGRYEDYMTGREFLQSYGTDICRKILPDCLVDRCMNDIFLEKSPVVVVDDGRFPNEIDRSRELVEDNPNVEITVIRLLRDVYADTHKTEVALDKYKGFDLVVPEDATMKETHTLILNHLLSLGWVENQV